MARISQTMDAAKGVRSKEKMIVVMIRGAMKSAALAQSVWRAAYLVM
jgi:hypothetical protein